MMCALAWNGRRKLVAVQLFCRSCAQAGMFFVFHCHRQTLCGHRTAQKMKHVAFRKTLRLNNRPSALFHLKQNVSSQRLKNRRGSNRLCSLDLTEISG
jgi:hypothetical protein